MIEIGWTVLCLAAGLFTGYQFGFKHGQNETERRWSEIVSKADYQRKYTTRAT